MPMWGPFCSKDCSQALKLVAIGESRVPATHDCMLTAGMSVTPPKLNPGGCKHCGC